MGRPSTNGAPAFRFTTLEVGEMEAILQAYKFVVPGREVLDALAQRFSSSAERAGKVEVSGKQVWNWFQNKRYAVRNKAAKTSVAGQVNAPGDDQATVKATVRNVPQAPQSHPSSSVQGSGQKTLDNSQMEFEAKSARDGAWYDVACFLSHRSLDTGDPEALVRLSGFGEEEDEWVNIRKNVRQQSLPCESSECVGILPGDLVLCFQEGREQALYFDARVLDAQRRRHDIRGCRCRFLVRYDHDRSEEIVPLRKICRRPETDYRLKQLYATSTNANQEKMNTDGGVETSPAAPGGGTTHPQKLDGSLESQIADTSGNASATELGNGNHCDALPNTEL